MLPLSAGLSLGDLVAVAFLAAAKQKIRPVDARYRFGPAEFLPAQRSLFIDGQPVALGGRAFDLLDLLVRHADRVVSKEEIFEAVWPGLAVQPNNLQVHVWTLRRILGASAIVTVARRGYRLMLPVQVERRASRPSAADGTPQVLERLRSCRVLTLTGATLRARRALAHASAQAFRGAGGPWLLEPEACVAGGPALSRVLQELSAGGLVVLHDAHRVQQLPRLCKQLLASHPAVRLLLTAPAPLQLPGEHTLLVEGSQEQALPQDSMRWLSRSGG